MRLGRARVRSFVLFCALGFEVLLLLRVRVRGFAPWAYEGSRFCAFCAQGFEVLRLGHARVRGFASRVR